MISEKTEKETPAEGVPMPIVVLNRWTLLIGILAALILQQPWITTLLFLMLLASLIGGQRWSLVAKVGRRLFAEKIPGSEREDMRLMPRYCWAWPSWLLWRERRFSGGFFHSWWRWPRVSPWPVFVWAAFYFFSLECSGIACSADKR